MHATAAIIAAPGRHDSQHELSTRIHELVATIHANPAHGRTAAVALFELAQFSQTVPGNEYLMDAVCGDLKAVVDAALGPLALLVALTEPRRRQVYFAVIARLADERRVNGHDFDTSERAALLEHLMLSKNKDLIEQAYGHCPDKFLPLITSLGERARSAQFYNNLFTLLTAKPQLGTHILMRCRNDELTDDLIDLLVWLPDTPLAVTVAMRFELVTNYEGFMIAYRAITRLQDLSLQHMERIADGTAPEALLKELYYSLPFADPIITADEVSHIKDGNEMVRIAKEFENCLERHISRALENRQQFYVWRRHNAPSIVFAITREEPFGWYLGEASLAENDDLSLELWMELDALVQAYGIRTTGSIKDEALNFGQRLFRYDDI